LVKLPVALSAAAARIANRLRRNPLDPATQFFVRETIDGNLDRLARF